MHVQTELCFAMVTAHAFSMTTVICVAVGGDTLLLLFFNLVLTLRCMNERWTCGGSPLGAVVKEVCHQVDGLPPASSNTGSRSS